MMMDAAVIDSSEFRNILKKITVVFLVSIMLMILSISMIWRSINQSIIKNNYRLIGSLVSIYPHRENEIIDYVLCDTNNELVKTGKEIAAKYGYKSGRKIHTLSDNNKILQLNLGLIILISLMEIIFILIIVYFAFKNIFRELSLLGKNAEKIMEENFQIRFNNIKEGEISKLAFQFKQMSKRLQCTLQELHAEKEFLKNMISNISHQLKTPLTSLKMFNELLIEGAINEPETRDEFLEKSLWQIDRMEWLIYTLLKIARLETGVIELNKEEDDIVQTIKDAVHSVQYNIDRKRQKIILENFDQKLYFNHDKKWMCEAVRNILKNAIDYTSNEGIIKMQINITKSVIRIDVIDNGIGIDEKDISKIFDRFYQCENSTKINKKGTGIGLSLSKLIVEKHFGYIDVKSKLGEGSTFTMVLPKTW